MRTYLILAIIVSCQSFFGLSQAQEATKQGFIIGERLVYHSNVLNEDRTLNIYLPNSYSPNSAKKYPVIYLLDGSKDEDFIHISGIVQFCSYSWINIIEESIVVGIENVDRKRDFTFPSSLIEDNVYFPTEGGSEQFMNFIENELQPYIDSAYKVNEEKTIIGQSLGGLLATEILVKRPQLFDKYIIVSPSLWWDNTSLLDMDFATYDGEKSIYITVGEEGKIMKRAAKSLYKKLKKSDNSQKLLEFHLLKEQNHGDALHLGVYNAFEAMQPDLPSDVILK